MSETVRERSIGATLVAAAMERLFEPRQGGGVAPRPRFVAFLLLCLLLHVAVLAFVLWQDWRATLLAPPQLEEIPVEVITEPPPEKQAEPPPEKPQDPPPQQQQQRQKPPPPATEIEKPAFDAPAAESKAKSERDAPADKEIKTPRVAPPTERLAPKDEKPQGLKDAQDDAQGAKAPAPELKLDDNPDAEIIDKAEPVEKPQEKPDPNEKSPARKGEANSIADQVAALAPLPDFQLAAPPKPSPVGGGHAKTTYLTILYGLIMPHMHIPPRVRASPIAGKGVVAFYIDEMGNLTHQAVYRSSGAADLDSAALAAVRRAAPFPPPPRGLPHAMLFTYATK